MTLTNKVRLGSRTKAFPLPALLLAVRTGEATANVMTVAWAGIVGNGPAMVAMRIGGFHYSTPHIDREMNFTLNVPSSDQVVEVDYCGIVSGADDPDKLGTCGWTALPSCRIASPIIAECPVNLECCVVSKTEIGRGAIYLAEILETHVDEHLLSESKRIDAVALDPLIYAPDGGYYRLGEKVGHEHQSGRSTPRAAR